MKCERKHMQQKNTHQKDETKDDIINSKTVNMQINERV